MSTARRSAEWIAAEYGARVGPPRPELVATHEQRRAIAHGIRHAIESIGGSTRGRALRDRALLIELEESPIAAAVLLAECEALGLEVSP